MKFIKNVSGQTTPPPMPMLDDPEAWNPVMESAREGHYEDKCLLALKVYCKALAERVKALEGRDG